MCCANRQILQPQRIDQYETIEFEAEQRHRQVAGAQNQANAAPVAQNGGGDFAVDGGGVGVVGVAGVCQIGGLCAASECQVVAAVSAGGICGVADIADADCVVYAPVCALYGGQRDSAGVGHAFDAESEGRQPFGGFVAHGFKNSAHVFGHVGRCFHWA